MEPLQGDTVTNDSCSCNSYDYNSESDCQTLIRLLAQGCRINRLFNGKYIPLRESKLLDELIKTRALYDALRNQLLSNSVSVSSITNLKPGQDPKKNTNSTEAKKSGDIFALVDLVDKGAILGSRKLSVCCSCCNCNSKAHLPENIQKGRRNRQAHGSAFMPSRSSVSSKHGTSEELKLGKQFKAKNIKSDPCTRAGKLEELIKLKLQSRVMLKKIRPEQPWERNQRSTITDKNNFLTINNDKIRKSYHKLKRYKGHPTQYIENMGEGSINKIRKFKLNPHNIELNKISSIEQLKLAQQKIIDSFNSDLKATQQSKPEGDSKIKNIVGNNVFLTRENTVKFEDEVTGKRQLQDWESQNKVSLILTRNNQTEKDDTNINISGRPNFGVRQKQYAIPERTANKAQKSPRKISKHYISYEKEKVTKDISKIFNKVTHAITNSIKLQIPKDSDPYLVLRDKKSSIISNLGIRNEQLASPVRKATNQQKSPPRKQNKNDTLDEKQKVNKNISKTFNKVTHAIENSIKLQKPRELYPSVNLQDKKTSAKSMTSIKLPEIVNKMENLPLSKGQEKKPMKSKMRRHPGKLLKSISTTSIEKNSFLEKRNRNTRQTVTKRSTLNVLNNKNKLKSDHSIQKSKQEGSSEAPMRFVPRERLHKEPPPQHENRPHEEPDRSKNPLEQKQKKKSVKSKSHALKRCLCTLKIKVKKTKSAITKIVTGEIPELKNTQSIKTPVSKTSHASNIETHPEEKIARDALKSKHPDTDDNSKENQEIQHQSVHKDNIELKDRKKTSTHASKCECSNTDMNIKHNKGSNNDSTIKPSLNHMTAKANNDKTISLNVAFECECIAPNEKGSLRYKKTNTHTDNKSTNHASTETKEKGKFQNHSVQTINNVTFKEKKNRKSRLKTNISHHETKSIFNRITKCKCPIVIKENIIMSSKKEKQGDVYTSKPRFSVQISKKGFSKDKFKISIKSQSVQKDSPKLKDREKISTHSSKCECSEANNVHNKESNNELRQTMTDSTIKSSSNHMTTKDGNGSSLNDASECECFDSKGKGSFNYKQTNTHIGKKTTNHGSTETKEKGMYQNHSVQPINNVTTKEKQSQKLYRKHITNTTHHETKSIFNRFKNCKCPIVIEENMIVSTKKQETNDDYNFKPRFSSEFSQNGFKIPHETNSGFKQADINRSGTKMKHIQNKQSQLSNSTGKLKYGLRKLKLGKFGKKKNQLNKHIKGAARRTTVNESEYLKTQPKVKSISSSREWRKINHNEVKLTNTKAKEARKLNHIKISKNSSFSSLTSRSVQLPRPKKINSILISHKSEIPIQELETHTLNLPTDTTQNIRSSFRTKKIHKLKSPATYSLSTCQCKDVKTKRESKISAFKNHDLMKYDKLLQKSSLGNENKRDKSVLLSPTIKRCLCTLKVHKKDGRKKKNIAITTNSETVVEKMYPEVKRTTRSPINIGIDTQKPKMTSKSSDTRKLPNSSKHLFRNSDFKQRRSRLLKLRNLKEYTELCNLPKNDKPKNLKESLRQGVEFGSNFSFNIEFYKDTIHENKFIAKRLNNMKVYFLNNNQKTAKQLKIDDNVKSCLKTTNVTVIPSVSGTVVNIKDEQCRENLFTPFVIEKPTQVYAMSTVTVAQSNTNLSEIIVLSEVNLRPRLDSYDLANCPEKRLNKTKQWQYLNKRSISSVFSIAFKSEKMQSYACESKCNLLQINSLSQSLLDFTSKEMVQFASKFELSYEKKYRWPLQRSSRSNIYSFAQEQDEQKVLEFQEAENAPTVVNEETNPPKLTGIQPFLRKCYCTMNIQVAQQSPKRRHRRQHPPKLKDYECEPGVCEPYECDPNECQKLIMKRLMKKVSRMSGTENRMKTSASITSSIRSYDKFSGKKTKLQSSSAGERRHRTAKVRNTGVRYQTLPRSPITQRQAVRIGSNFSFNMEFSKGSSKSAPTAEFIKESVRPSTTRSSNAPYRHRRDRGTRYEVDRQHKDSQSMMKQMRHRASNVTPMIRRCFCTLKLQKKGRQQKERELQILHQGTSTPPKLYVEKPILRTTETSQNTKIKRRFPELLPYECEPHICVPGECDPYECLELIKKRRTKYTRDLGTDSLKSKLTSSSSMTSSQRRTRQRHVQSRNIHMNQTRSRDTIVRSKPSVIESQVTPTRQAVRLGSSLSFNIEFFKDKSAPTDTNMGLPETYEYKSPRHVRKVTKPVYTHHKVRERYSQDRKSTRDTLSQIGLIKHGQSTMTGAFLKRCFCTAKLQGIKVDSEPKANEQHNSISTLKRCLCHLKELTTKKDPKKAPKVENEQVIPLPEKHFVKTQTREKSPILEPYECEPGVCVPGRCDPYECEKLIRRRRAKEKGVGGTTRPRTRSTSSSFTSSKTSKARMTQSKPVRQYERTRNRNPRGMIVKEQVRATVSPQKQVVKIGSNFSFNIEFYKDSVPNLHQIQTASSPVRKSRPTRDQAHEARKRNKTKDKRLMGRGSSVYTRGSQMDVTKTKDQSLGPMLKRCFCTLKLHKEKQIRKEKQINQGTATPVIKEVPTLRSRSMMTINKYKALTYNLKPYECEPGFCVPGECDPLECDKRIKKRLMSRASGTLTDQHHTRSTASTIRPHRRYRDRDAQSMRRTKPVRTRDIQYKVKRPKMRSDVVERTSKQAVNMGSNLSFSMEFFKDRSPGSIISSSRRMKPYGPYERPRRTTSRYTEFQSSSRNKKAQRPTTVRDMDSQVLARKMRSTMTGVGPFLKRCFCTLQLHKSEKDKKPFKPKSVSTKTQDIKSPPKVEAKYENLSTLTRTPAQFYNRKLEPYECEPGVCVPGECDPYECEKRIKKRMQSKQSSTNPHRGRSVSSSIGESSKSRHRRIQALSSTPSSDQYRSDDRAPSTDSSPNRQAVRIGSSFSFNVEFYKERSPQLPSARDVTKIIRRGIKGTETRPKRPRSTSSYSKRAHTRHCQSQSDCIKTECKSSCAPLLKRCFCTLKLQKMGKQDISTKIEPTMKTMGTAVKNKVEIKPVAREIGTKTKRYTHPLEPYECEPGVCVPGLCDPYECEQRIKLRNMKDFGTGTTHASMKSMYSLTSRDTGTKAMNTYRVKNRKPPVETVYEVKRPPPPIRRVENVNRQSVHLGSNFSFNLDFFKDQGGVRYNDIQTHYTPRAKKSNISSANRIKLRNQGSYGREKSLYHRQLQAGAQTESRGSGMGPLKRCFCTLTLQRAEVKNTLSSPVAKHMAVKTQDKKTATKKYYPPSVPLKLESYECEPYVCTPGECDPYECLERIKRRGIRRISRTTGTRMKRNSQMSQMMPGYTSKRSQFKGEGFSPQKVERIVEEPRFSFLRGNPTRQGVKISSNFSFNIEFFKEVSTPGMADVAKKCQGKEICQLKDTCTECKKTGHSTNTSVGQHRTRNYLHDNMSQSESVKTEDKSSAVAILRRCFCTAKLHRPHLARTNYPQSLTVGRVEEVRPVSLFGPKEYWVQYQIQPVRKNTELEKSKDFPNMKSTTKHNKTTELNKLETIMSYIPRKFNKNNDTIQQKPMGRKSESTTSTLRKMVKCCKNLFVRRINHNGNNEEEDVKPTEVKHNKQPRIDVLKASKSERHPYNAATAAIKKSRSFKGAITSEKTVSKKKYSRYEFGDAIESNNAANKPLKTVINYVEKTCPNCHVQFKQHISSKQVRFALSPKGESLKSVMKPPKESKSVAFLYISSSFKNSVNLRRHELCTYCGGFKSEKTLPGLNNKNAVVLKDANILPQKTREKDKTSCPCCICRKREIMTKIEKKDTNVTNTKQNINITKTGKQDTNVTQIEKQNTDVPTTLNVTFIPRKKRPCICGSVTCKEEAEKLADKQYSDFKKTKIKKCVCGTNICTAESMKETLAKESGYMRARRKKREEKNKEREAKMRELSFKKEDKEIMKRRKLNDKYMMKKLKKYKETSDIMLLAESLLDIGKLGITSATDILRNVGRTVIDPKRTYRNLLTSFREPMRTWKKFQDAANDGPGVATLKRIKLRCKALTCLKKGHEQLEAHPVTNFVLHANDKDPRRRMQPKKVKQPRRDPGFACSPFMLSLRKRPWLIVYYTCSWFYPHCLSLLQVWRQFMDVMLFLLAVAVWSPCILCMELSRALMCCFLCTG